MISVCIPIYNFHVVPLVSQLRDQAQQLDTQIEIVCIDDASDEVFREQNAELHDISTYILLDNNIGRAAIRNAFLQYAHGDYLLFLDNDSQIKDGFLSRYIEILSEHPAVVVGGRIYDRKSDCPECHLRYLYGIEAESRSAEQRREHPYNSFMTNNFMIRRDLLEKIRFDNRLTLYGHEDTLFGYRLEQSNIPITHINNPVVNGDVETNEVFLQKTEEAIQNLSVIYMAMAGDERFCKRIRLLSAYRRLRQLGLIGIVHAIYRLLRNPLRSHFLNGNAISIRQFNFYKLGLFIEKQHYPNSKNTES